MQHPEGKSLQDLMDELDEIINEAHVRREFEQAKERLIEWKIEAISTLDKISKDSAREFSNAGNFLTVSSGDFKTLTMEAKRHRGVLSRITPEPVTHTVPSPPQFDVFLSHNSKDKPEVKRLGEALKKRGLIVWLDEWELQPGLTWMDALEDIITTCKSAAVCVGAQGIGPWEQPEMQALLRRFVNEKRSGKIIPVIPILLPGAPDNVKLPVFLEAYTWVDLRPGLTKEGLDRVQWGITGVKSAP
jgi:hypothetical protein